MLFASSSAFFCDDDNIIWIIGSITDCLSLKLHEEHSKIDRICGRMVVIFYSCLKIINLMSVYLGTMVRSCCVVTFHFLPQISDVS